MLMIDTMNSSGPLSELKTFVLEELMSFKPDLAASHELLTQISDIVLKTKHRIEPGDDFADFPDLVLFPKLHEWLDAKMSVEMDSDKSDSSEGIGVLFHLLICMDDSLSLLYKFFNGTGMRESLDAAADKVSKDKKLWVILVSISKALTESLATFSKVMVLIDQVHGVVGLAHLDAVVYNVLQRLCRFISHFGFLEERKMYKSLLPLMPMSSQTTLFAACNSLAKYLDFSRLLKEIGNMDEPKWDKLVSRFKDALIWYGDLLNFLLSMSHLSQDKSLINLLFAALENLVYLAIETERTESLIHIHVSFYLHWLLLLISKCPLLPQEGSSVESNLAHIAFQVIFNINFKENLSQPEEIKLFDLWSETSNLLLNKGKVLLESEGIAKHRAIALSHIEAHLRQLGRSKVDGSFSKMKSFESLSRLAAFIGAPLMSEDLDGDSARLLLSFLATMRKSSLHLISQIPDDPKSFEASLDINKAVASSLWTFSITTEMDRFDVKCLNHGPLIHFLPALNTSSQKVWRLATLELNRLNQKLTDSKEQREQLDTLISHVIIHLLQSINNSFDSLASVCHKILQYTNVNLPKAMRQALFEQGESSGDSQNDNSASPSASNRRPDEEGQLAGEHLTEEATDVKFSLDPAIIFFPIAMIYASGALTEMLGNASSILKTLLETPLLDDYVKLKDVIEPVSRVLGSIMDLASALTCQSRVIFSKVKAFRPFILLHLSLTSDMVKQLLQSGLLEVLCSSSLVTTGEGHKVFIHLMARIMKCLSSCSRDISLLMDRSSLTSSNLARLTNSSAEASRRLAISLLGLKQAKSLKSASQLGLDSITQAQLLGDNISSLFSLWMSLQSKKDRQDLQSWRNDYYESWEDCLGNYVCGDKKEDLVQFCCSTNCQNLAGDTELSLETNLKSFSESPALYCQQCMSHYLGTREQGSEPEGEEEEATGHPGPWTLDPGPWTLDTLIAQEIDSEFDQGDTIFDTSTDDPSNQLEDERISESTNEDPPYL